MNLGNSSISTGGRGFVSESSDDNLFQIHGNAIGSNDITRGHLSGERKLWIPEVLEEAANTLEGKQIVVDHENRSSRDVVGQITDAKFQEGVGVIYQGVLDDEELASKIDHGWLEVSPRIIHSEEMEELEGVKVPQEIYRFDNLSIVSKGAAKSNEINLGEHDELAEELQSAFESEGVVEYQQRIDELQETGTEKSQYRYDNIEGAQGAAQGLNCSGFHETTVDGEKWYMPCSSRNDFIRALKQKMASENEEDSSEEDAEVAELLLSEARTPQYSGTEEKSWSDIDADTLSYFVDSLGYDDVEQVDDLTQEQKSEIAEHTLLGDPEADNISELRFFPVVNAETNNLNRGALEAVRGGRGQSADISDSTYASAYEEAGRLLEEEFDADIEVEMQEIVEMAKFSNNDYVTWNNGSGYGKIVDWTDDGIYDASIDGDKTIVGDKNDPAALIQVYEQTDEGWTPTDTMVGYNFSTLKKWDVNAKDLSQDVQMNEIEELAYSDEKSRIASMMSSHSELTKEQAMYVMDALNPSADTDLLMLSKALSTALGAHEDEMYKKMDELLNDGSGTGGGDEEPDDSRSGLRRALGMSGSS